MKFHVISILLIVHCVSFSQTKSITEILDSDYFKRDSVYIADIDFRTQYLAKLNKDILPSHFHLKSKINLELKHEDREKISILLEAYIEKLEKHMHSIISVEP